MNATDDRTTAALDALTDDGDSYTYTADGREYTIRLHMESDPDTNLADDGDWFGTISAWQGYHSDRQERPAGFNGLARKVNVNGEWVWWQPPAEVRNDDQAIRNLHDQIHQILEYGYTWVGLSLHETVTDSRGGDHDVTVATASLGGVEPFPDREYLRDVISELLVELFDT